MAFWTLGAKTKKDMSLVISAKNSHYMGNVLKLKRLPGTTPKIFKMIEKLNNS